MCKKAGADLVRTITSLTTGLYLSPQEEVFLKVLLRKVVLSEIRNKNSPVTCLFPVSTSAKQH